MDTKKRLLLADRHAILREGLRSLLERKNDYEVVGDTADGSAAVKLVEELRPQMIILDVDLVESDGFAVTRQVKSIDSDHYCPV